MDYSLYLTFFFGLLAIINPVGLLPIFVGLTSHQTDIERNKTADIAHVATVIILIVTLFAGKLILEAFSISIPAFRFAGGVLIFTIAMSMLQGMLGAVKSNQEENREFASMESVAVVPLAMPLMAGPGAISSVIVYGSEHNSLPELTALVIIVVVFGLLSWSIFRSAPFLFKFLGKTGINVITRIMGLIMLAISVELMAAGIKGLFPNLA